MAKYCEEILGDYLLKRQLDSVPVSPFIGFYSWFFRITSLVHYYINLRVFHYIEHASMDWVGSTCYTYVKWLRLNSSLKLLRVITQFSARFGHIWELLPLRINAVTFLRVVELLWLAFMPIFSNCSNCMFLLVFDFCLFLYVLLDFAYVISILVRVTVKSKYLLKAYNKRIRTVQWGYMQYRINTKT